MADIYCAFLSSPISIKYGTVHAQSLYKNLTIALFDYSFCLNIAPKLVLISDLNRMNKYQTIQISIVRYRESLQNGGLPISFVVRGRQINEDKNRLLTSGYPSYDSVISYFILCKIIFQGGIKAGFCYDLNCSERKPFSQLKSAVKGVIPKSQDFFFTLVSACKPCNSRMNRAANPNTSYLTQIKRTKTQGVTYAGRLHTTEEGTTQSAVETREIRTTSQHGTETTTTSEAASSLSLRQIYVNLSVTIIEPLRVFVSSDGGAIMVAITNTQGKVVEPNSVNCWVSSVELFTSPDFHVSTKEDGRSRVYTLQMRCYSPLYTGEVCCRAERGGYTYTSPPHYFPRPGGVEDCVRGRVRVGGEVGRVVIAWDCLVGPALVKVMEAGECPREVVVPSGKCSLEVTDLRTDTRYTVWVESGTGGVRTTILDLVAPRLSEVRITKRSDSCDLIWSSKYSLLPGFNYEVRVEGRSLVSNISTSLDIGICYKEKDNYEVLIALCQEQSEEDSEDSTGCLDLYKGELKVTDLTPSNTRIYVIVGWLLGCLCLGLVAILKTRCLRRVQKKRRGRREKREMGERRRQQFVEPREEDLPDIVIIHHSDEH